MFPARLLSALPSPTTMLCEACLDGLLGVVLVVTTCAEDYTAARQRQYVTLHGAEFAAMVLAVELGRASPADFERWCALKKRTHEAWELTPQLTLGGVFVSRHAQRQLPVGEVLRACGATLLNVASAAPAPPDFWEVTP